MFTRYCKYTKSVKNKKELNMYKAFELMHRIDGNYKKKKGNKL